MHPRIPVAPVEDVLAVASGLSTPRVGVASRRMRRLHGLAALLGSHPVLARRWNASEYDVVLGWGRKPKSRTAHALATRLGKPFITVEDGFLRSRRVAAIKTLHSPSHSTMSAFTTMRTRRRASKV